MKWKSICLEEITRDFISGGTPDTKTPEFWSGTIPWITGADVVDGKAVIGRRFISKSAVDGSATNIVPKGSILLVTRTGVGKIAIAPEDIAISQDLTGIVLKDGFIPYFAMWAIYGQMSSLQAVQRGATIKGVLRKDVARLPIPFTGASEQRRIVALLEQADGLRRQRAEADQLADRILPTLFYKMFGDPATNSKNWPKQTLGLAGAAVRYGLGQPPQSSDSGLPLIRATNIHRGLITSEDMIYVRREDVSENRNAFLKAEEVIVVRSGAYTGDIAQVTERWAGSVAGYDLVVSPGEKYTGEFLESYLLTPLIQRNYFGNIKARAGQPHLNADQLLNTPMMLPPKPVQEIFSRFVNTLRDQRVQRTESVKQLKNLFATMLHRAFTGELTAKWREAHLKELLAEMEQQARLLRPPSQTN